MTHTAIAREAALGILALATLIGSASAGQVTLADGDFASGWTASKLVDTTPGASATFSVRTQPTGGFSGAFLESTHTIGAGTIVVGHTSSLAWNPADAAISVIYVGYRLKHLTAPTAGGSVRYRLLLQQNGSTYHHAVGDSVSQPTWSAFNQLNLVSTSFVKVSGPGPSLPDFSCSGAPIGFGFSTEVQGAGGLVTRTGGLDEIVITLIIGRDDYLDTGTTAVPWSSAEIADTSPGGVNAFSVATPGSGGNPSNYREVTHVLSSGSLSVAHLQLAFPHEPMIWPVYSIDFAYDAAHFTAPPSGLDPVGCQLLIRQGGAYYAGPVDLVHAAAWTHFARTGILASDLDLVAGSGPPHPDLGGTGAPFEYGFLTSSAEPASPPGTKVCGFDNLLFRRHIQPPCGAGTGTVYCDGNSALAPCPCYPALPAGAPGHGCPNSVFPAGGRLVASGVASLSADTLVLQGTAMPNSSCIYLQGTAAGSLQFGDGLRCAAGALIRLGSRSNASNSSQYPQQGETPVSVRGQVASPGQRYYQVWYRNVDPTFCTPAGWNLTNGLEISWGA